MPFSLHISRVALYAGDTSLAYAPNSVEDITKFMNTELENRCVESSLLYVAKTTSMIIGTNRKLSQSNSGELIQAHFKISGEAVKQKA